MTNGYRSYAIADPLSSRVIAWFAGISCSGLESALQTTPEIIIRCGPGGSRDNSLGLLIRPGADILPPGIIERPATAPGLKFLSVKIG